MSCLILGSSVAEAEKACPGNARDVLMVLRFGYWSLIQVGTMAASASPANTVSTPSRQEAALDRMFGCATGFGKNSISRAKPRLGLGMLTMLCPTSASSVGA